MHVCGVVGGDLICRAEAVARATWQMVPASHEGCHC